MATDTREIILGRIRENLSIGGKRGSEHASLPTFEVHRSAKISGHTGRPLVDVFEEELTLLGAHVTRASSQEELLTTLTDICQRESYRAIVLSREPYVEESGLELELGKRLSGFSLSKVSETNPIEQLQRADVGITACDYLAAETGTIVLRSSSAAPRTLSLLPRAHIVIAKESQLLPTVAACLEKLRADGDSLTSSSCITLVTGSSRTADIEKVLVKGVHGPKDLYVLVVMNPR